MTGSHKRVNPPSPVNEAGGLPVPPAQPQLPAAAHPTASRTLTTLHRCAKFQRVMIPKVPFKIPGGGTERRMVTPETPTTGWVGDRRPMLPDGGPHHHGWWRPPNPTLEQDEAMIKMEVGKKKPINFYIALKTLTSLP